ncbi:hypothetical protein ACLSZN_10470, partial [Avibacterium avium]
YAHDRIELEVGKQTSLTMDNEKILLRFGKNTILMNEEGIWLDGVHIGMQEKELQVQDNTGELKPLYRLQFHLLDDEGRPYPNTPFSIKLPEGEQKGITDENGLTPAYFSEQSAEAEIRLHIDEAENDHWSWK